MLLNHHRRTPQPPHHPFPSVPLPRLARLRRPSLRLQRLRPTRSQPSRERSGRPSRLMRQLRSQLLHRLALALPPAVRRMLRRPLRSHSASLSRGQRRAPSRRNRVSASVPQGAPHRRTDSVAARPSLLQTAVDRIARRAPHRLPRPACLEHSRPASNLRNRLPSPLVSHSRSRRAARPQLHLRQLQPSILEHPRLQHPHRTRAIPSGALLLLHPPRPSVSERAPSRLSQSLRPLRPLQASLSAAAHRPVARQPRLSASVSQ